MDRRDFVFTLASAMAASFAASVPLIRATGGCSFCQREYPEAAWIQEAPDGSRRICDGCAEAVESAITHLGREDYDAALEVLERKFPGQVKVAKTPSRAPFLMM